MTMLIGKLEPFSGDEYQSSSYLKIWKIELRKKPCLWITGRLYVINTYEQKLIWTDFQGMTTLIGKLESFSGDVSQKN